jgi:hypothetical protein
MTHGKSSDRNHRSNLRYSYLDTAALKEMMNKLESKIYPVRILCLSTMMMESEEDKVAYMLEQGTFMLIV